MRSRKEIKPIYLVSVHLVNSPSHRTATAIDARALLEGFRFLELGHVAARLDQFDREVHTASRLKIDLVEGCQ